MSFEFKLKFGKKIEFSALVSGTSNMFSENSCTSHLAALWRRLQMLQESVDTTDVECLDSSSYSPNGSTSAYGVDNINEILATSCYANS